MQKKCLSNTCLTHGFCQNVCVFVRFDGQNFVLGGVEHEKSFITSWPGDCDSCLLKDKASIAVKSLILLQPFAVIFI